MTSDEESMNKEVQRLGRIADAYAEINWLEPTNFDIEFDVVVAVIFCLLTAGCVAGVIVTAQAGSWSAVMPGIAALIFGWVSSFGFRKIRGDIRMVRYCNTQREHLHKQTSGSAA